MGELKQIVSWLGAAWQADCLVTHKCEKMLWWEWKERILSHIVTARFLITSILITYLLIKTCRHIFCTKILLICLIRFFDHIFFSTQVLTQSLQMSISKFWQRVIHLNKEIKRVLTSFFLFWFLYIFISNFLSLCFSFFFLPFLFI